MKKNDRYMLFLLLAGGICFLFYAPLRLLIQSVSGSELYSHILLIPPVSIYLVYSRRREIFNENVRFSPVGMVLLLAAVSLFFLGKSRGGDLSQNDYLSLMTFGVVIALWGGFLIVFGTSVFRTAAFPMLFLLFTVPVPEYLMDRIISLLQYCSTEVSYAIFNLTGVPIYRDGFIFHLPGLIVEVAKQCGGIRSSLALFITSILAGHLFLRTGGGKLFLAVAVFPITIFKNSVRIVFLSLYGAYVDPGILSSVAHRRGGIPFFIIAMGLLGVVLWIIRRMERRSEDGEGLLEFGEGKA